MIKKLSTLIKVLILFLACQQILIAQGKMKGVVTDIASNEPLFGANVVLLGTSLGAATNFDGEFFISDIPAGKYTLKVSYIGYEAQELELNIPDGATVEENVELKAVSFSTDVVEVTAQAVGQNAAINQQLSSDNIVNVVSSARIQELPDKNAAESIGRLPGVSLQREGGQATQVVIRGLKPSFNKITVGGVEIPANSSGNSYGDSGGRGVDMRMISSSALDGIELVKTNTPDMDAAVLGGTVNLGIRKARADVGGIFDNPDLPAISILAQGGYNDIDNTFKNLKFDLSLEKRFFDNKFGLFAQGVIQQKSLTTHTLGVGYTIHDKKADPNKLRATSIDLTYFPREEIVYNGTLTFDYQIPEGSIALLNMVSHSETKNKNLRQRYTFGRAGNDLNYYANYSPLEMNMITNILTYEQNILDMHVDAKLSHSYSENISPDNWEIRFSQLSTGTSKIDDELNPKEIAAQANEFFVAKNMELYRLDTWQNFTKQRDFRASLDLERTFHLADFLSLKVKAGGMYSFTDRYYDRSAGSGSLWNANIISNIVSKYPWLESQYGIAADGTIRPYVTTMYDNDMEIGTFLNGDYQFSNRLDFDILQDVKDYAVAYGMGLTSTPTGGEGTWVPNTFDNVARDYTGKEDKSAGYLMGTFKIKQLVTIIAGARYQNLTTEYGAARFYNCEAGNTFPFEKKHVDTTVTRSHGYWIPAVHIKVDPTPWLSVRAAYTKTLAYPDPQLLIPRIHLYSASVTWNDIDLKPQRSENYDIQMSIYNNYIGLLTVGGFLKNISDFIFHMDTHITDPTLYEGLEGINTLGYALGTEYNNPNVVELYGIEADWQTHFWYLPKPFDGLVLNINYTHNFSDAKYPLTITKVGGWPDFQTTYTDTNYSDKLQEMPEDIVNVSLGYDYKDFSILVSMIYQSSVFNSTNFYNSMRRDKDEYLRWDLSAKQTLPWYNMEVFLNLANLNNESDTYIIRGSGFPTSQDSYGLTVDLGLRVKLN